MRRRPGGAAVKKGFPIRGANWSDLSPMDDGIDLKQEDDIGGDRGRGDGSSIDLG